MVGGRSAVLLAGDNTAGHPPGTKAGDVIHIFQSGSIQMVTDVSIDPATMSGSRITGTNLRLPPLRTLRVPPRLGAEGLALRSSMGWRPR